MPIPLTETGHFKLLTINGLGVTQNLIGRACCAANPKTLIENTKYFDIGP